MKRKYKNKLGMSLLEVFVVISIVLLMTTYKMQSIKEEIINKESVIQSDKLKMLASAVNGYINMNYKSLIELKSDGANKICDQSKKTCEIKIEELKKFMLLPQTFSLNDRIAKDYKIVLKREGAEPNYMINGLLTAKIKQSSNYNRVFMGKVLTELGVDGGISDKSKNKINGFRGFWSETTANYNNINNDDQIAMRVGYSSNMYSVYLRRDGSLPMTGNLNLGGNDINNVKDLTMSGNLTTGKNANIKGALDVTQKANIHGDTTVDGYINGKKDINAGAWLTARNGYGDVIKIGGDKGTGASDDFEIVLTKNKPLSIHASGVSSNMDDERLRISGSTNVYGNMTVGKNVFAREKVGAGGSLNNLAAYIEKSGNIYASKEIKGKTIVAEDSVYIKKEIKLGEKCDIKGLMGRTVEGQLASCVNLKWAQPSAGEYVEANIKIPAEGLIDFKALLPDAKGIQIRYQAGIHAHGNCCPSMSLTMDGKLIMAQNFDTGAGNEYITLANTIIISNDKHTFKWNAGGWWSTTPSLQIIGYFK